MMLLSAAGVSSGEVHDMAAPRAFSIRASREPYYLLDKTEGNRVDRVIFQRPAHDGKGVLVAPTVHGNLIVGPNAEPVSWEDTAAVSSGLIRGAGHCGICYRIAGGRRFTAYSQARCR